MIKSITVTNHLGESITIELRSPEKSGFFIRDVDGLGPPKANIDTTEVSAIDGSIYNSARANSRNIVLTLGFLDCPTIEDARQKTYKYFPLKKRVTIQIETDNRIGQTYGFVESNEPDIFSKEEGAVISIVCPDSYFYSPNRVATTFSFSTPLFEFPFENNHATNKLIEFGNLEVHPMQSVYYTGDAGIGIVIFIHAIGGAIDTQIVNVRTLETLNIYHARLVTLLGSGITAGDDIIISTVKGDKYAILRRGGVEYNIRNAIDKYPSWFVLERGDNIFSYTAVEGGSNLQFRIENQIAYEGM